MCSNEKEGTDVDKYVGHVIRVEDAPSNRPGMSGNVYGVCRCCYPQVVLSSLDCGIDYETVINMDTFTFTLPCTHSLKGEVIDAAVANEYTLLDHKEAADE